MQKLCVYMKPSTINAVEKIEQDGRSSLIWYTNNYNAWNATWLPDIKIFRFEQATDADSGL